VAKLIENYGDQFVRIIDTVPLRLVSVSVFHPSSRARHAPRNHHKDPAFQPAQRLGPKGIKCVCNVSKPLRNQRKVNTRMFL